MKVLPPAILFFEALVIALAIPVAVMAAGRGSGAAWTLAVLAALLLLAAGMARRPAGVRVGWVLQAAVIATGLLVPAMLALGLVFLAVWVVAVIYGSKADRFEARHQALVASSGADEVPAGPSPAGSADATRSDPLEPSAES